MSGKDEPNEQELLLQKRHETAINALTFFVSKFSPAGKDDADTFYSTTEIQKAIADHTGVTLDIAEIFELMEQMKYSYEASEGLEFNWLLKK